LRCRCDAVEQQDGAVVGAPSPLLTSKTAQRLKVSMMSLGCPKNVVDGAHQRRTRLPSAPGASHHRRCRAPTRQRQCNALALARRLVPTSALFQCSQLHTSLRAVQRSGLLQAR
jgi:hypothetical protein